MTKKVLIADDEPNIVTSLQFLMERNGYEVRVARSGDEALEQVGTFLPDLVLLDVMMPAKNGYEVCQKIKENEAWAKIKVIMLTAKGRDTEVSKGIALGADAYTSKPFSTKELVTKVRELLGE
ncbi:MAG: response regulator [Betaproteobacteria bacterium]|jgi:DNA-binding response OmpR family regulator|nr:response regulator [Betaproteobacteria bacterium]